MQTNLVNGIEELEIANLLANGSVDEASWEKFEDLEADSVSLSSNQDTKTSIIPEDKDSAILVLYTPGDPDVFNFALLQMSPIVLGKFFNILYDPATSKITVLSKRKRASLAMRITTRPVNGVKKVFTFGNTLCEPSYKNNIAKNGLLSLAIAASILPYKVSDGAGGLVDAHHSEQLINDDGTVIDSTLPTVTITGTNTQAGTTANKNITAVGVAHAAGATIIGYQWEQVSGANDAVLTNDKTATVTASGMINGVYVFRVKVYDSNGAEITSDVQLTNTGIA